jgi:hypothetical protein
MMEEPAVAFAAESHEDPEITVLVNFGLFVGREATRAEIDRLAARLLPYVSEVSIVAEDRHQFDQTVEACIHIVRIEVPANPIGYDPAALQRRIIAHAEAWTHDCTGGHNLTL